MPALYKAADADSEPGTFEAIVSVFNNKDLGGDIVRAGAFEKSLALWRESGDPIPIYWSHRMDDPTYNIGYVEDAREVFGGNDLIPENAGKHIITNGGLYIKGRLDDHGLGAHVSTLLKQRRVKQFSFSYDVVREQRSKSEDANELLDLWLHEVGPTPLGMNPLTELIAAKAAPPDEPPDKQSDEQTNRRDVGGFFAPGTAIEIARLRAQYAD